MAPAQIPTDTEAPMLSVNEDASSAAKRKTMSSKFAVKPSKFRDPFSGAPEAQPSEREDELTGGGRIYEYTSAANPEMSQIPILSYPAELHQSGETRTIPLDLKEHIQVPYSATSPNLLVSYVRIVKGENIDTQARATSQAFYVISGKGSSDCGPHGKITWATGDMVAVPRCPGSIKHSADEKYDCSLYWVTDEPLLKYLGVTPSEEIFRPTVIRRKTMLEEFEKLTHEPGAEHRNRMGILLGNMATDYRKRSEEGSSVVEGQESSMVPFPSPQPSGTLTLTPTLWSLLNMLPPNDHQMPHRHNSVAIDLCVYAPEVDESKGEKCGVYTNMGPELGPDGMVKDPIRCDWKTGACFVTPPGWWHSHHNETGEQAWVLPMQDAGLLTYQRVLDIQFSKKPVVEAEDDKKDGQ